jgi:MoxR-like ATPase
MTESAIGRDAAARVLATLEETVVGQHQAAEALLAAYMAGGHALVEGVPGIGKTLLARAFAGALGLAFARIQFTPDLMPTDVTGMNVFDAKTAGFRLTRGPLFTQILMADEINRTPPKTQSALLEAMQEGQVTIDGARHALPPEFFVVATQNPLEFEGTYPLPEAQLDRFLLRIEMGLPARAAEIEVYRQAIDGRLAARAAGPSSPVVTPAEARELRQAAQGVHVSPELLDYLVALAARVRGSSHLTLGPSPRAALALLETARAAARLAGRDFLLPDDLKRFLVPCWGHRIILAPESELEGQTARRVLDEAARTVPVPK